MSVVEKKYCTMKFDTNIDRQDLIDLITSGALEAIEADCKAWYNFMKEARPMHVEFSKREDGFIHVEGDTGHWRFEDGDCWVDMDNQGESGYEL